MPSATDLLQALPVAVYTTDSEGRITFYNEAAAALWGHRPRLGTQWCGSWRLYWPDGRPMAHAECPLARTIREGGPVPDIEIVAERPDGSRVPLLPRPALLKDDSGKVTGTINVLVETSERRNAEIESARLAAIVATSDDAIISKTLQGVITTWNAGASRIFGYSASEMIGQSIYKIIPPERRSEEDQILAKLQRGERIDHFDTVRMTKDGRRVDISLTISPIRDRDGNLVGASKVARDVTERKAAERLQQLLFDELNHRVKNTLATVQAIASQSLRRAPSPADFVASFTGRIHALALAHGLLFQRKMKGADIATLVREQVILGGGEHSRVTCSGPFVMLNSKAAVQLALVLHELATNARKHGALSVPRGRVSIVWKVEIRDEPVLLITWAESGGENVPVPSRRGFGTTLIEQGLGSCGGRATVQFGFDGITCEITLPVGEMDRDAVGHVLAEKDKHRDGPPAQPAQPHFHGGRILVVEDEVLVGMEIQHELTTHGFEVVGPAGTLKQARQLVAGGQVEAALLDVNLNGSRVDDLARMLRERGIPFAFVTGYGARALPEPFGRARMLSKPFAPQDLVATVNSLLRENRHDHEVVPLPVREVR